MVIGGHFGGGDHFYGGDHFGGGTSRRKFNRLRKEVIGNVEISRA